MHHRPEVDRQNIRRAVAPTPPWVVQLLRRTIQYPPEFAFHNLSPCQRVSQTDKVERELASIKTLLASAQSCSPQGHPGRPRRSSSRWRCLAPCVSLAAASAGPFGDQGSAVGRGGPAEAGPPQGPLPPSFPDGGPGPMGGQNPMMEGGPPGQSPVFQGGGRTGPGAG